LSTSQADVDLAEFAALRAEIVGHQSAQTTLVSVCLTAIGVVIGLVLSDKGAPGELLLVVPLISSGLGLFYASHSRACLIIGQYIRIRLWPRLRGAGEGLSWEEYLLSLRRGNDSRALRHLSLQFLGGTVVFVMPSVGALVFSAHAAFAREGLVLVWALGVVLLLLHVSLATLLAVEFREDRRSGPSDRAPLAAPAGPAGL
jgi:hypothetical protein